MNEITYIPTSIRVHLGPPDSPAKTVTISFVDYIKNIACSSLHPTWCEAALRANIIAQISFTLNRIQTQYYKNRGYDFHVTSVPEFDQTYQPMQTIFQNISLLVDELFNTCIRCKGFMQPLLARFSDKTEINCNGLSRPGSQSLASNGSDYWDILTHYFGDHIELFNETHTLDVHSFAPNTLLQEGSTGTNVFAVQSMLNQIALVYPCIPSVQETGLFDETTVNAVQHFQEIVHIMVDGIVGKATWHQLICVHLNLNRITELAPKKPPFIPLSLHKPLALSLGAKSQEVYHLQHILNSLSLFDDFIEPLVLDGVFGDRTERAVILFQEKNEISATGILTHETWDRLLDQYDGIQDRLYHCHALFFKQNAYEIPRSQFGRSKFTTQTMQYPGTPLYLGVRDTKGGGALWT